ncbi:MAG: hypothetical protein K8I27_14640 [Planctomycetes bacterium]|nr:hypothetical protein [Planctomycetota bacterium]
MIRYIAASIFGLGIALLVGGCSPQAEPATPANAPANNQKEADVKPPAADQVAATYHLKIEGMT